jgi:hypothetical protein
MGVNLTCDFQGSDGEIQMKRAKLATVIKILLRGMHCFGLVSFSPFSKSAQAVRSVAFLIQVYSKARDFPFVIIEACRGDGGVGGAVMKVSLLKSMTADMSGKIFYSDSDLPPRTRV